MHKITADEAAALVEDGDAVLISGSGGGHSVPEALLAALERRFLAEGRPRGITSMSVVGVGDRISLGADHVGHEGLLKRAITSALVDSPRLVKLAAEDKIEAYTLPQGVMSQMMRDMAAGRPGLVTKTGLHSFVDPRQQGARQSPRTPPDFIEVVTIAGEEWLLFKPLPIDVAFLRGTTADADGNVTMEEEAVLGEMLAMAQATRRQGGIVVVQVKRMARRATLPAKQVKIPGILVDFVVVEREQRQTYATYYDPSYSGELRVPDDDLKTLPFGPRKVIVRRGAMELFPGAICNLGAGVSTGISTVAAEEGLLDDAKKHGAQVAFGGDTDEHDNYISPTVITDIGDASKILEEEIFGPLLPVITYRHLDEALEYIRRGEKPLALYVFSSSENAIENVIRNTAAGGTSVNDCLMHIAQEDLPFGGVGASGMGAYHGEWGFRTFSKETGVYHQSPLSGIGLLYPPYGAVFDRLSTLIRRIG